MSMTRRDYEIIATAIRNQMDAEKDRAGAKQEAYAEVANTIAATLALTNGNAVHERYNKIIFDVEKGD